jgi:hypothetical protein
VVFCHAEIQVYWEKISRRVLLAAQQRWNSDKSVDRVIATLVAFRPMARVSIPENPGTPDETGDFSKIVEYAFKQQQSAISSNNGIKSSNLAKLLCPLGFISEDFPERLLIQSDQTGKKRGDLVHKSSKVSVRTIRDPFADEKYDIEQLIAEIRIVDGNIERSGVLT